MPEKQLAREEGEKGKNDKKTDEWRKEIQKTRRYEPEGRQPDGRRAWSAHVASLGKADRQPANRERHQRHREDHEDLGKGHGWHPRPK